MSRAATSTPCLSPPLWIRERLNAQYVFERLAHGKLVDQLIQIADLQA
jgi:hypothetical protein